MNNPTFKVDKLEANLNSLRERLPDLPVSRVMLSRLLLYVGRGMSGMFEQELRPFGLAEAEFRVLTTLFSQLGGANPSDLCARASQSPANMSRISDALVLRGLITRVASVEDRRKMVLRITDEGETLVRQLLPRLYGPLRVVLEEFSEEEIQHLVNQLKRLALKLDEPAASHVTERAE